MSLTFILISSQDNNIFLLSAGFACVAALLFHAVPYIIDGRNLRRYPGPLVAQLSDAWLGWIAANGTVNVAVQDSHAKYGTFVAQHRYWPLNHPRHPGKFLRIAPNHVSIADASALHTIYGHGNSIPLKSELYDAFKPFNGTETIVTTRSRVAHARKRKLIAHTFSMKSVTDFEPVIRKYNRLLMQHWDRICAAATKGQSGVIGECTWTARDGYAFLDCLLCKC